MRKLYRYLALFLLIPICAPSLSFSARRILINGEVYSRNGRAVSEALVIEGSRILFVGSSANALKFKISGKTVVSNLKGKTVVPGFHDGNMNFGLGASLLESRFNFYGLDLETIIHRLKNERKKKGGEPLFGFNFEHLLTSGGKWPNRYDLDKVSLNSPIAIFSSDGTTAWVNSHTLNRLKLEKNNGKMQGGRIHRFANRSPSGILMGNAVELLGELGFKHAFHNIRPGKKKIQKAIRYAHRFGITAVTTSGDLQFGGMLEMLDKEGKLNLRFNIVLPSRNIAGYLIRKINFSTDEKKIRYVAVTKKVDGSISSLGAAMFSGYGRTGNFGFLTTNVNDISDLVSLYRNNGIIADFNAEGDRAVHVVLNGIGISTRRYKRGHHRYRLSGFCFVIDEDIERLKQQEIIPVLTPSRFVNRAVWIEKTLGQRKSGKAMRIGTLRNKGVKIAFGSGWPGGRIDPLRAIRFAVLRTISGPDGNIIWFVEEKIPFSAALDAYTFFPSYAVGTERTAGSIEAGKLADLVILEGARFSDLHSDVHALSRMVVGETIFNGKTVYIKKN